MKDLTSKMKRRIERDEKHIEEMIGDRKAFRKFWGVEIESILDKINK